MQTVGLFKSNKAVSFNHKTEDVVYYSNISVDVHCQTYCTYCMYQQPAIGI